MDQCRRESCPAARAAGGGPSTPPARKVKARPSEGGARVCLRAAERGRTQEGPARRGSTGQGGRRYDGKGEIMKEKEARNRGKDRKRGSKQKGRKDVCQNRPVRGH